MIYEYLVILGYFAMVIGIAFSFKKLAKHSTSDYFRGGGRMLWWMVGSAAFMAQFSAWTFTGAAGKAFTDGFAISLVFFANSFAYICGWAYFARRFRQMRVDTPTEGIKRRFGHENELFFSWAIIVFGIINGGVWLNALGVFTSSFFQADISITIIGTGLSLLLISVISGAWGVVASDFIQTLVVVVVSIACAIVALIEVGGPVELVTNFPSSFIMGPNMNYGLLLFGTFVFFLVKQMITIMNLNDSYRFLTAKDSKEATKAAALAATLMGFGSIIFFIPPWAAAILYPDIHTTFPELGSKAVDSVYLVFTQNAMPIGTVGLLVAGLCAATMSSMDSSLNKTSGIFVRSVYQPLLRKRGKEPSDQAMLRVGMLVSLIAGLLVIIAALFFKSLKELSLFDLMMQVSTMIQVPLLTPLLFGIFIKRTPLWAPWMTVVVGMCVSWYMMNVFSAQTLGTWLGMDTLTSREAVDLSLMATIAGHLFITAGFFCSTALFYKPKNDKYIADTEAFFKDVETPVYADSEQDFYDQKQRDKLGSMVMIMGAGVLAMTLIPNPVSGRIIFLICAVILFSIGFLLKKSAKAKSEKTM